MNLHKRITLSISDFSVGIAFIFIACKKISMKERDSVQHVNKITEDINNI
jgi:hypothetical protein